MEGMQKVQGLSAAQIANQQKSGHVNFMAILAAKGEKIVKWQEWQIQTTLQHWHLLHNSLDLKD